MRILGTEKEVELRRREDPDLLTGDARFAEG
jgi:hypothetical protein